MPKSIQIKINPQVLIWAREEAGYKKEEIAGKLKIPTSRYIDWELGKEDIPLGYLKKIANHFKRQLAVFLLPAPPPKIKKPRDFRNLALSREGLSPDILLAIRRTGKYLSLAARIAGNAYWKNQYQWLMDIKTLKTGYAEDIIKMTDWLRHRLKISPEDQKKFYGINDAFQKWRNSIENELGVFVFQFDMPDNEVDGFSYAEHQPPYAIVINKNIPAVRKIFTLFHELAHIFRHQSGICQTEQDHFEKSIELECNEFAGKFLVPDPEVQPITNIEEITTFARQYHVSREVYLRRNLERQLISRDDFFTLLSEIREIPIPPRRKPKGYPTPPNSSKSTRGKKFFDLVLNAVCENKIDYLSASDALGLGYSYIAAYE